MKKSKTDGPKNGFAYDYDDDKVWKCDCIKALQFGSQGHDGDMDGNHRGHGTKGDTDILKNQHHTSPDNHYPSSPNGSNIHNIHNQGADHKAKKHHDNQSFQMDFE